MYLIYEVLLLREVAVGLGPGTGLNLANRLFLYGSQATTSFYFYNFF